MYKFNMSSFCFFSFVISGIINPSPSCSGGSVSVVSVFVVVVSVSLSSSKIGVVSSGCSGFNCCCICLYSLSGINSVFFKYYLIMCVFSSFVGLGCSASSCVAGSCILK